MLSFIDACIHSKLKQVVRGEVTKKSLKFNHAHLEFHPMCSGKTLVVKFIEDIEVGLYCKGTQTPEQEDSALRLIEESIRVIRPNYIQIISCS